MSLFATRYASAFADVAQSAHMDIAAIDGQLQSFLNTWELSPELREVYDNPGIPLTQKIAVLDGINAKLGLSRELRNLLALLIDHDRIQAIQEIADEYRRIARERQGIQQAIVTTTRTLGEDEKFALMAQIAQLAGSKIEAEFTQDASLIGGAVIRIGSTVYDGSVKGRLERLKETLLKD